MSDDFLHVFMGVGNENSVISKLELADQDGLSSGSRLERKLTGSLTSSRVGMATIHSWMGN